MRMPDAILELPADEGRAAIVRAATATLPLSGWLRERRSQLCALLLTHGAIVLRGFRCADARDFGAAIEAMGSVPQTFKEESSPRTAVRGSIFTSTEHPCEQEIFPHNEWSYLKRVPQRVFFYCERPAAAGGDTPLVDGRRLLNELRAGIRDRFEKQGWMYIRRYGAGLGLSWQTAYGTESRSEVEQYCEANHVEYEWRGDGLITRQRRPAIIQHPDDGQALWFNHVCFFHRGSLPADLLELLAANGLAPPFDTRFGSGEEIPPATIEEIRATYRRLATAVPWQAGDVAVLDNLRMAHGRRPYRGDRRILFAAANAIDIEQLRLA